MSADVLRQVSSSVLRHLDMRPRATVQVLRRELPDVVTFFWDEDDLDAFEAAVLCAEAKAGNWQTDYTASYATGLKTTSPKIAEVPLTFLLLRYRREPADQLTVFLPGDVGDQNTIDLAIWRIVAALNLRPSVIVQIFPAQSATYHESYRV